MTADWRKDAALAARVAEQKQKLLRGTVNVISETELEDRLATSLRVGKPLRVKLGVDPTSSQLHLGFTVVLNKLRAFQDLGHVAVLIIGDATALVGDPTGRNTTRPRLTQQEVDANAATYLAQAGMVLDLPKVELRRNGEWLGKLGFHGMIELLAKRTAAQILEREDFRTRWDSKTPIFMHEMVYPLLQGRDSVEVRADVELGGTDQLFNLLVGRDLQADAGQQPQICMTLPILPGLDGVQKMSKSYGNTIGLLDSPDDMFGKVMSVPDALVRDYFLLTTQVPEPEIGQILGCHPRDAKVKLGRALVGRYHGEAAAEAAADRFRKVFSEKQVPDEMPDLVVSGGSLGILDLVMQARFAKSKSDARRLVEQGGVTLDGVKVSDVGAKVSVGGGEVLRVGKLQFARLREGLSTMEFDLVLSGGDAVVGGRVERLNVAIRDGRIAAVTSSALVGKESLDCRGQIVLPGCIDTHVHFREPGRIDKEDFRSGTKAAAAGGLTTVLEIQNNEPFTTDRAAAQGKIEAIGKKALVNYGIYGSVGSTNLDQLEEMAPLVVAFKVFMAQSVGHLCVPGLGDLARAFQAVARTGRVLAVHAESEEINKASSAGLENAATSHERARPAVSESVAVAQAIELARVYGTRLHLPHLSTARSVALVKRAKEEGLRLTAATCPHYLHYVAGDAATEGNQLKVNPSIKSEADREALIEGIRTEVIDHVHSDHAPHKPEEKAQPYDQAPSGIAGAQYEVPALLDLVQQGRLTIPQVASLICENPARAFGLSERGEIRQGWHADLTVVDAGRRDDPGRPVFSRAGPGCWTRKSLTGAVIATVVGGRIIFKDGQIADTPKRGARVEAVI